MNTRTLGTLFSPSWFSGLAVSIASLSLCLGIVLVDRFKTSSLRLDFIHYDSPVVSQYYGSINQTLSQDNFIANLPLLMFWGLVGLIIYLFVTNILGILRNTAELKHSMNYVHANRRQMIGSALVHMVVRLAAALAWWAYSLFFIHSILPYCLAASLVGASPVSALQNSLYVVLAILVMAVSLHVFIMLARLTLLRPRLFSGSFYTDELH